MQHDTAADAVCVGHRTLDEYAMPEHGCTPFRDTLRLHTQVVKLAFVLCQPTRHRLRIAQYRTRDEVALRTWRRRDATHCGQSDGTRKKPVCAFSLSGQLPVA